MIALDTNIFIYWLERNEDFYAESADIIKKIHSGVTPSCCSVLVISEIHNGTHKPIEAISSLPNLTICDVTKEIAELAGKLRHKYAIKVIDAIHIASAINNKAKKFITNDQQLTKLKIPGLTIETLR